MNVTVTYNDIEFEIDGYYEKGENRTNDYPGSNSAYEIEYAYVNGIDISILLSNNQIADLENLAIEEIENE